MTLFLIQSFFDFSWIGSHSPSGGWDRERARHADDLVADDPSHQADCSSPAVAVGVGRKPAAAETNGSRNAKAVALRTQADSSLKVSKHWLNCIDDPPAFYLLHHLMYCTLTP
jgi:hypothetical protein